MDITMMQFHYIDRFLRWCGNFDIAWKKRKETIMDTDRVYIPKEKLTEYIHDAIPELEAEDIREPRAWRGVAQGLPLPTWNERDLVVWNDQFIAPTHGARIESGEGPFVVRVVDDYIIAFTKDADGNLITKVPKTDRITVETPKGRLIIAHPGYFKLFKE